MDILRLAFGVLCFVHVTLAADDKIRIIDTNPSKALVKEGNSITLSCRPSHSWFLCLWVHPSGRKACSIQEGGEHRSVCSGLENTKVMTVDDSCKLEVKNVTVADHGVYMCLFSQAGVFHTDRAHIGLEVATPAETSLRIAGDVEEREDLDLLEGETVHLECNGRGAYPAPEFFWSLMVDDKSSSIEVIPLQLQGNTVNGSSYLNYTASTSHSGWSIICHAIQRDGEEVLYSSRQNVSLIVTRAEPLYADMASQKGVLTGIFMSSILLILCISAVLIFVLKRNKKGDVSRDLRPVTRLAIWSPHGNIKPDSLYSRPNTATIRHPSIEECMVEMPESSSSSTMTNSPAHSHCSSTSLNRTQSVGDIVEGNFISFSPSDMYSHNCGDETEANIERIENVEESQIVNDESFKTSTMLSSTSQPDHSEGHWEDGSEGGVSVISVFDCQHGCFHADHSFSHCHQHGSSQRLGDVQETDM